MLKDKIFILLDDCTKKFFPETGYWNSTCFKKPKEINEEYFPCHTRDSIWLSLMFQKKFNLFFLTDNFIKEYIEQSEIFDIERKNYEQKIVEWQINFMNNGGEHWIVDPKLGGDLYMLSPKCDIAFRKGIVDTLLAIGMNVDAIEEGIEKNADKWRPGYMRLAFSNMYDPIVYYVGDKHEERPEVDSKFKENWFRLHLYEYYQNHKSSVDRYGEVLPEMSMDEEEVEELKGYLEVNGEERLELLENNRKKEEKKRVLSLIKNYN